VGEEDSVTSNCSLDSLNASRTGRQGLDLSMAVSYSMEQAKDKDIAWVCHLVWAEER
jgi:hypothetical protein